MVFDIVLEYKVWSQIRGERFPSSSSTFVLFQGTGWWVLSPDFLGLHSADLDCL
jgi:hypothetical protein